MFNNNNFGYILDKAISKGVFVQNDETGYITPTNYIILADNSGAALIDNSGAILLDNSSGG